MKTESFIEKMGFKWTDFFKDWIESKDPEVVYSKIKKDSQRKKIFPKSSDVFNAFKYCDIDNLKLIVILMEPYSGEDWKTGIPQSDGIAMSCSNSEKIQPSLVTFFEGLANEYSLDYESFYKTNDLKYLSEQGVLLGNRSLTVRKSEITSHVGLWDNFWKYFFEKIQSTHPFTPILFMGEEAAFLKRFVFEMANPMYFISHPSSAARNKDLWETEGLFSKINNYLRAHKNTTIKWSKKMWEETKENLSKLEAEKTQLSIEDYNHQKMLINLTDETFLPF